MIACVPDFEKLQADFASSVVDFGEMVVRKAYA
jgi:hypothetical protein